MKHSPIRSAFCVLLAASLAAAPVWATCGGGGGGGAGGFGPPGAASTQVYYVPWKILTRNAVVPDTSAMVLYWFPRSEAEAQASELTQSRSLTNYSAQCVAMALVPSDRSDLQAQFEMPGKMPAAVLVAGDDVLSVVEGDGDKLRVLDVERAVRDAVKSKKKLLDQRLAEGKAAAKAGESAKAIEIYESIVPQKCLFPKQARSARKALKKLGVEVGALDEVVLPDDSAEMNARMVQVMEEGLAAEEKGDYKRAQALYTKAMNLDPGDAVPLRFLGELERHHTGAWDVSKRHFEKILTMHADPISQAVALHGLGKLTIHSGEFDKGLGMFHQSVELYPLALTYRNLAVYWNSEGEREKAMGFVRQAMNLDPHDSYNIVFAATYLAEDGKYDEARKIAEENMDLMPASYNLAAIYALSGERDKSLALLRRHFYEFEQHDEVRNVRCGKRGPTSSSRLSRTIRSSSS